MRKNGRGEVSFKEVLRSEDGKVIVVGEGTRRMSMLTEVRWKGIKFGKG